MADFLALSYKIPYISSLGFANAIKRTLGPSKIGFLGTLDPFACGQLILACGSYTKLLNHINIAFKTYKATLFLGLESSSLDSENVRIVRHLPCVSSDRIYYVLDSINGRSIEYLPPKFSAKHINGVRSYELARKGVAFETRAITSFVKSLRFLGYSHPFLSFEITISSGGYVRSIADIIAKMLYVDSNDFKSLQSMESKGALCYLERVSEDEFCYKDSVNLWNLDSIKLSRHDLAFCKKGEVSNIESKNKVRHAELERSEKKASKNTESVLTQNKALPSGLIHNEHSLQNLDSIIPPSLTFLPLFPPPNPPAKGGVKMVESTAKGRVNIIESTAKGRAKVVTSATKGGDNRAATPLTDFITSIESNPQNLDSKNGDSHITPPLRTSPNSTPLFANFATITPPFADKSVFTPPFAKTLRFTPPFHHNMTGGLGGDNMGATPCIDSIESNKIIPIKFSHNNIMYETKLVLLDIKKTLNYGMISLLNFCDESNFGKKIVLDSKICESIFAYDTSEPKRFLADFGAHFGIIDIYADGRVKYILNRIKKC